MGFVMLVTVVYLLSFLSISSVVPTILAILGLSIALWQIGRISPLASKQLKLRIWTGAAGLIALSCFVSFGWLKDIMQTRFETAARQFSATDGKVVVDSSMASDELIAWQSYSADKLESLIQSGTPVFVDFTADWCLTCKANEAAAIETSEFAQVLKNHGIVALRADKTHPNPDADRLLRRLGNSAASIPYYAVFSPNNPGMPQTLDGVFTSPDDFINAVQTAISQNIMADVTTNHAAVVPTKIQEWDLKMKYWVQFILLACVAACGAGCEFSSTPTIADDNTPEQSDGFAVVELFTSTGLQQLPVCRSKSRQNCCQRQKAQTGHLHALISR